MKCMVLFYSATKSTVLWGLSGLGTHGCIKIYSGVDFRMQGGVPQLQKGFSNCVDVGNAGHLGQVK